MTDFEWNRHGEPILDGDQDLVDSGREKSTDLEEYLPTEKSDEEVLEEAGVDVQVDGTYDMATRQGREALAKDLHHEMRDAFVEIAAANQDVLDAQANAYEDIIEQRGLTVPVNRPPFEVMVAGSEAIEQKADEIEEDVYNQLAVAGATEREIGQEEVYEAVASAVTKYHVEVDRMEGKINLEDIKGSYQEEETYKDLDADDLIA